jgi:hypothetical protein
VKEHQADKHSKGMRYLELNGTKVTDAGLVHVGRLTGLMGLNISGTKVTDAGLVHLKPIPKLTKPRKEFFVHNSFAVVKWGLLPSPGIDPTQDVRLPGTIRPSTEIVRLAAIMNQFTKFEFGVAFHQIGVVTRPI